MTIKAFMPADADTVSISAGAASARVALDPNSSAVLVQNKGPNEAFFRFGGSGVTATTSNTPIASGACRAFTKGAATHVAAICAGAEIATVRFTNGEGL